MTTPSLLSLPFAGLFGLCCLCSTATAQVQPPQRASGSVAAIAGAMPNGTAITPPAGFVSFCAREPTQCKDDRASGTPVHLDARTRALIVSVNNNVNRSTRWVDDETRIGVKEHFDLVRDGKGDCEDIALTKRKTLHEAGIPFNDLRIAIGRNAKRELHAVLVVRTDTGDLVLDSPDTAIRDWRSARIAWWKRQDGSALGWETIPHRA